MIFLKSSRNGYTREVIWANFLHFYQPPTQKKYWVDRITDEAYRRILHELEAHPDARLTINIAAVLLELWDKYGHQDVIAGYRKLIERGQIEVTGSAKFHPLLPKLPDAEIIRQIYLNELTLYKYLGVAGPILNREQMTDKRINGVDFCHPDPSVDGEGSLANASTPSNKLRDPSSPTPRDDSNHLRSSVRPSSVISGFFPPEMAFDRRLAGIVARLGYRWVICDEYSYNDRLGLVAGDRLYAVEDLPLNIFFRERGPSFKILSGQLGTAKLFTDYLGTRLAQKDYLLTAMDGETFGHHRPGLEKLLFELYELDGLKTATLSELTVLFKRVAKVPVRSATWALMAKDLEKNAPFARWDDADNEIHARQWQLTDLAIKTVNESRFNPPPDGQGGFILPLTPSVIPGVDPESRSLDALPAQAGGSLSGMTGKEIQNDTDPKKQWQKARTLLDRALHSDQYWWASARPWWSLEMVEAGARDLQDVVLTVPDAPPQATLDAKRLYFEIITTGFDWQRTGMVETRSLKEDEEIRERTDRSLPKMPPEEIRKMIKTIEDEMLAVAGKKEYERATQLRDRIKELEEYLKG